MFYLIAICTVLVSVGAGKAAVACILCALGGFGLGRIKNALKLQAIRGYVVHAETYLGDEARNLARDIKSHL